MELILVIAYIIGMLFTLPTVVRGFYKELEDPWMAAALGLIASLMWPFTLVIILAKKIILDPLLIKKDDE